MGKAETPGDGTALIVTNGAANFDAMQVVLLKAGVDNRPTGLGSNAVALELLRQPVADTRTAMPRIDGVESDGSRHFTAPPDAGREAVRLPVAIHRMTNVVRSIA